MLASQSSVEVTSSGSPRVCRAACEHHLIEIPVEHLSKLQVAQEELSRYTCVSADWLARDGVLIASHDLTRSRVVSACLCGQGVCRMQGPWRSPAGSRLYQTEQQIGARGQVFNAGQQAVARGRFREPLVESLRH